MIAESENRELTNGPTVVRSTRSRWSNVADDDETFQTTNEANDSQTDALRVIAAIMIVGLAWAASSLLVPFFLAIILTLALSPVASWLESRGLPKVAAGLLCTLVVAGMLAIAVGLILFEAGTIAQDSDRYIHRFGSLIDDASRKIHPDKSASDKPTDGGAKTEVETQSENRAVATEAKVGETGGQAQSGEGERLFRRGLNTLGHWLASGVGGMLGALGEGVVFLAFLFYMLQGREGWLEALTLAAKRLGMHPAPGQLVKVQKQLVRYISVLAVVACCYAVVVSLVLSLIGVPQAILWGLLAGMLEVVPYFGPLVASVMPTVVALSLGSWWQPGAVALFFLVLHVVEGYVVSPLIYGKAIRFDPVTILLGALIFGGLWGPVGLAIATPMMIVLRGLLVITPDTPALDALAEVKTEKIAVARESLGTATKQT